MAETQRDPQITDRASSGQDDESRDQQSTSLPVSRTLANPRRVRRA